MEDNSSQNQTHNNNPPLNIPIPDPSVLTIAAIDRAIATTRELTDQKFEAIQKRIDEQYLLTDERLKNAEDVRNEKFDAVEQLRAEVDLRNQQRFDAQTKALDAAFLSAQTAVTAALNAADKGIQAAMTASEKAVSKAEMAAEKRFDSSMEFQKTFNDSLQQQIPRKEAETRFESMSDKFDSRLTDMSLKIDDLKAYANTAQGRGMGGTTGWLIGGLGFLVVVIALIVGIAWSSTRQVPVVPASTAITDANSKRIDDLQERLNEAQRRLDEQAASGAARTTQ